MYFAKSTPHFSHDPPLRCSCLHAGHSNRSVAWHRGQNRATSRASAAHLGHLIMRCGIGVALSDVLLRTPALGAAPARTSAPTGAAARFSALPASAGLAAVSPDFPGVKVLLMLIVYLVSAPIKLRPAENAACR